jgi:uncharacterized protein YukE
MSSPASSTVTDRSEWDRLELAARRLIQEYTTCRRRLRQAEDRIAELERSLHEVAGGTVDPLALQAKLRSVADENQALRARLAEAGERVTRIRARLQFLEEER